MGLLGTPTPIHVVDQEIMLSDLPAQKKDKEKEREERALKNLKTRARVIKYDRKRHFIGPTKVNLTFCYDNKIPFLESEAFPIEDIFG